MVFSEHMFIRVQPTLRDSARVAAERAGLTVAEFVRRAIQREIYEPTAAHRPSSTDLNWPPGSIDGVGDGCPQRRGVR